MSSIKTSWRLFTKKAGNVMAENGSTILTILAIGGLFTSILLAIEETSEAEKKLEELEAEVAYECEHEHKEPPTKSQMLLRKAKVLVPVYAPTIISASLSTACIVGAHKSDSKKIAVLTTAYELSEAKRRDYIRKVKEEIGEKAESKIRDSYYKEEVEKAMPASRGDGAIIETGNGDQLFYDDFTKKFFRCDTVWLDKCRCNVSHRIYMDTYADMNEMYYNIGMPTCDAGKLAGWNSDDLDKVSHLIDINYTRCFMTPWGETCAIFETTCHDNYVM